MTVPSQRGTGADGFTALFCGRSPCAGAAAAAGDVVAALRGAVRAGPGGVLVAVDCLSESCRAGRPEAGRLVVVQPCDTERRPVGRAVVAGPLHEPADVEDLCRWLRAGVTGPCPGHLRVDVRPDPAELDRP